MSIPPLRGNHSSSGLQVEVAPTNRHYFRQLRQRSASSVSPLPERTYLGPQSAARQTHLCPSQLHYDLHPAMFSRNDSLFSVASITRYQLLLIYLSWRDWRLSWP